MTVHVPYRDRLGLIACDCKGCDAIVSVPADITHPQAMLDHVLVTEKESGKWTVVTHYRPDGSTEWMRDYCSAECSIETCWHGVPGPVKIVIPIAVMK